MRSAAVSGPFIVLMHCCIGAHPLHPARALARHAPGSAPAPRAAARCSAGRAPFLPQGGWADEQQIFLVQRTLGDRPPARSLLRMSRAIGNRGQDCTHGAFAMPARRAHRESVRLPGPLSGVCLRGLWPHIALPLPPVLLVCSGVPFVAQVGTARAGELARASERAGRRRANGQTLRAVYGSSCSTGGAAGDGGG